MRKSSEKLCACVAALVAVAGGSAASAVPLTFTKLSGLTGASPAGTAIYRADLSGLSGTFAAISITDASFGLGGSAGRFSGFDLDGIKLSTTACSSAACAASATGLAVFNFGSGVVFQPGAQRAPTDPKLFGTGPAGNTVDNGVATLGLFDAASSTTSPAGFVSLGDGGTIAFNLTSAITGTGLYLYLGEVGDNGEVAASNINVLADPVRGVPEPATWSMMVLGFGAIGAALRRRAGAGARLA